MRLGSLVALLELDSARKLSVLPGETAKEPILLESEFQFSTPYFSLAPTYSLPLPLRHSA
jgi:hypothetical protein